MTTGTSSRSGPAPTGPTSNGTCPDKHCLNRQPDEPRRGCDIRRVLRAHL